MWCRSSVVFALTAAALLWGPASSAANGRTYQTPAWVQSGLDLDIAIDYERPAVSGTATLTLVNGGKQPMREVPLLLNRLMSIREVRDAAGRKLALKAAVTVFEDDRLRQALFARVLLPRPVPHGRSLSLTVAYAGALSGFVEAGNLYVKDRIDRQFTILRDDAYGLPTLGVPSEEANDGRVRGPFRFRARVTVPEGQVVATGGRLVDRRSSSGRTTFEFAGDSVPFLNVSIAPYRVVNAGNITIYALPADEPHAAPLADATRRALARLESWYGEVRMPGLTIIEIPDGFGSQASLTAGIILEAVAFRDRDRLRDLYHEVTHFWNVADLERPSPRWNEGLAMYLQYRIAEDLDGFAGTGQALERMRTRVCDASVLPALRATPFVEYGRNNMTDSSYRVGLLMFSALDRIVGREKLDAGLRAHIQGHAKEGTTTAQLVDSLSAAARPIDLGGFFRDWMFTTGWADPVCSSPSFTAAIERWRSAGR